MIRSLDVICPPIILELKVAQTYKGLEDACDKALNQIKEKEYGSWLLASGRGIYRSLELWDCLLSEAV